MQNHPSLPPTRSVSLQNGHKTTPLYVFYLFCFRHSERQPTTYVQDFQVSLGHSNLVIPGGWERCLMLFLSAGVPTYLCDTVELVYSGRCTGTGFLSTEVIILPLANYMMDCHELCTLLVLKRLRTYLSVLSVLQSNLGDMLVILGRAKPYFIRCLKVCWR